VRNIPWAELKLEGELSLDSSTRKQHSEDASIYREEPLAVAFPKNKNDLQEILAFARKYQISLHAWGAGTSRGGQPLGAGLILNFRKYWNHILRFEEKTQEVIVEPGVYYSELQKFLKTLGRSFPPDPSYHQCTVGGMVANNAAGIHSVKYGGTIEHVAAVEYFCVEGKLHHSDHIDTLAEKALGFLKKNEAAIANGFPKVEKNSSGYALDRALSGNQLDLPKLFTGSEGTLGLITELRLKTVAIPSATALGILYFPDLERALQAAMDLRSYDIAACELVDKVLLDLHADQHGQGPKHAKKIGGNSFLDLFYESKSEAVLIVELEGKDKATANAALHEALHSIQTKEKRFAENIKEEQQIWDLRRHTSPILNKLEDGKITIKPLWAVEDVSLPPENFLAYVREQQKLFEKHGLSCSFFGHAASCNLHIDPIAVDPRKAREDKEIAALYDLVTAESYALCIKFGGSISGEHGDGLTRTPFLSQQYPEIFPLFAELKAIFDPAGLLNPGKIVMKQEHT
jgi:FAD/FMN-containing dehydrogenase